MDKNTPSQVKQICIHSIFLTLLTACAASEPEVVVKYQYDALGRLSYVEDIENGNRDYDYDKAGNRVLVATSTASDATKTPEVPPLPVPTGLTVSGPRTPISDGGGGWDFSWSPVPGAVAYAYQLNGEPTSTITTETSASSAGPRPYSVEAIFETGLPETGVSETGAVEIRSVETRTYAKFPEN
ncbi:MAG: hypothetical protein RL497_2353 [Pseudomonadota bacterium]